MAKLKIKKTRLDLVLLERGLVESRSKAQALIMAGKVRVAGEVVTKAGMPVTPTADIDVESASPYVSRGGLKLEAALEAFAINPVAWVCADVGASTGGFTDVMLQRGAERVYAIDVGYGQLAWKLRQDDRVISIERTNVRYLESLPEAVRLISIDVSFISLRLVLPVVARWLESNSFVVPLVKPQFEAGREQVGKGGIVREPTVHKQALTQVSEVAVALGFDVVGLTASPIKGGSGNQEFLLGLGWQVSRPTVDVTKAIALVCS